MTIDGNDTTIHHNCTHYNFDSCGLEAHYSNDSIHLASPLTIETIVASPCTVHPTYANFGGHGTIAIVDNEGTIIETIREATPEDDSEDDSEEDY